MKIAIRNCGEQRKSTRKSVSFRIINFFSENENRVDQ